MCERAISEHLTLIVGSMIPLRLFLVSIRAGVSVWCAVLAMMRVSRSRNAVQCLLI